MVGWGGAVLAAGDWAGLDSTARRVGDLSRSVSGFGLVVERNWKVNEGGELIAGLKLGLEWTT
jgi:hypothetical protein